MDLNNKVAIITGGASGLGEATVRRFAGQGVKVSIFDMNEERGKAVAEELGDAVIFNKVDVTDEESVQSAIDATVAAFGAVHICCNYAGLGNAIKTVGKDLVLAGNEDWEYQGTQFAVYDFLEQLGCPPFEVIVVAHPDRSKPEHRHLVGVPVGQAVEPEDLGELTDTPHVPPGIVGTVSTGSTHRGEDALVRNEVEEVSIPDRAVIILFEPPLPFRLEERNRLAHHLLGAIIGDHGQHLEAVHFRGGSGADRDGLCKV